MRKSCRLYGGFDVQQSDRNPALCRYFWRRFIVTMTQSYDVGIELEVIDCVHSVVVIDDGCLVNIYHRYHQ